MSVERAYFFERALLGRGVAHNVRIEVDEHGFIGRCETMSQAQATDTRYAAALPGMPNVHSHAHQYALAGRAERSSDQRDSFWTWREVMYRFALRMTPEQLGAVAAQLYVELLKGGYTSVGEFHYLHHDPAGAPYSDRGLMSRRLMQAAAQAGLGFTLLPVFYRYGDLGGAAANRNQRRFVNDADDYVSLLTSLTADIRANPLFALGMAPHSLRAVDKTGLQHILANSPLGDTAPIHIHIAEQQREVDDALEKLRRRPVQYLLENFDINQRWCLVHATHMEDSEVVALARSGAVAGICPTTEANLGDGVFRCPEYLRAGGRIAVGSDSNTAVEAAGELRLLEYAQRLTHQERNVLSGGDNVGVGVALHEAAARGGALALAQPVGQLATGLRADFVTLNTDDPLLCARDDDIFDAYIFAAGARAVDDVYVGGRVVLKNGHHAQEDTIAAACRAALRELAS
ncbi:MAG: formimidoylglutamate deiminase [Gammaproteobacteria bacterium]